MIGLFFQSFPTISSVNRKNKEDLLNSFRTCTYTRMQRTNQAILFFQVPIKKLNEDKKSNTH